jgi:hypothetical protein
MEVLLLILVAVVAVAAYCVVFQLRGIKEQTGIAPKLICERGKHFIGNEPYTFVNHPEDGAKAGEPICFRCIEQANRDVQALIKKGQDMRSENR